VAIEHFGDKLHFFPHRAGLEIEDQQVAPDLLDHVARWLGSVEKPIPVALLDCKMILAALGPCRYQSSAVCPLLLEAQISRDCNAHVSST
jgi:hypothetical protein